MAKRKRGPVVPLLLPLAAENFVGREAQVEQLVRALQPGRTVTLFGPEGIGKRALAAEAIARLHSGDAPPSAFPDGVVTLSCEHYPSELLLLAALARALGGVAHPDPHASVRALLGDKRLLIVLENVHRLAPEPFDAEDYRDFTALDELDEELDEATDDEDDDLDELGAAEEVRRLLVGLRDLLSNGRSAFLFTAAHRTPCLGEVIELGPLSAEEGCLLLAAYAGDLADDVDATVGVVELLDGLPLSLMLAAVWMVQQDAPVASYLAALESLGLAALPPEGRRNGGVAAVYQLLEQELDDNARAAANLLALLAAAPLPIPLLAGSIIPLSEEDLDEFAPDEEDVESSFARMQEGMQSLIVLVDYGLLVEFDGSLQYRHFLLRHLVIGRNINSGQTTMPDFAARVASMIQQIILFAEMLEEEGDAALAPALIIHLLHLQGELYANTLWAYACEIAVRTAGIFKVPAHWYELFELTYMGCRAVARLEDTALVTDYAAGLGMSLAMLGLDRAAAMSFAQALAAAEDNGDEELVLATIQPFLHAHLAVGNLEEARRGAERFLALAEQSGDPQLRTNAMTDLARVLIQAGGADPAGVDLARAAALVEQAVEVQRPLGDDRQLLSAILNASAAWRELGDIPRSLAHAEPAVEMARRLRDRALEAAALINLGNSYHDNGEARRALRTYEKALEAARRSNENSLIALSSWRLANSVEQSGNGRAALKYYEQCLAALDPAEVSDPTLVQVQAKIAALRG